DRRRSPLAGDLSHVARVAERRSTRLRARYRISLGVRVVKRIGIDVGGTNTDAVLVNDGRIESTAKATTSEDVTRGILQALEMLRARIGNPKGIGAVLVGTTPFISAVIQRRHLHKVAAIRVAAPATMALPPFSDWPQDLARLVDGGTWAIEGGHDYDGRPF